MTRKSKGGGSVHYKINVFNLDLCSSQETSGKNGDNDEAGLDLNLRLSVLNGY